MNSIKLSLVALGAAMVTMTSTTGARADDAPAAAGAPPPFTTAQDRPVNAPLAKPFKPFSVELNPLAAGIGRYSVQVEWLPAVHHAILLNPHFDHTSYTIGDGSSGAQYSESLTGFGGELGYRYYTGEKGANGFYVGPSLIAATYTSSASGLTSTSFSNIGAAVDVGGQWIIGPGIVVGAGFGLQYTTVSSDLSTNGVPLATAIIAGGGVRPRFLLSLGYAF